MSNLMEFVYGLRDELREQVNFYFNIKASSLTTFGLGAPIKVLAEALSIEGIRRLVLSCKQNGISWRILGAGSNVILPDETLEEIIIRLAGPFKEYFFIEEESLAKGESLEKYLNRDRPETRIEKKQEEKVNLLCFARAGLMQLSRDLSQAGFGGLEYASGIPATVGGALCMNAGAHGWDIGSVTKEVVCFNSEGEIKIITAEQCGFAYRTTALTRQGLILGALITLKPTDTFELIKRRKESLSFRRKTQPLNYPSAGSVFKNPCSLMAGLENENNCTAGELLEKVGLKGFSIGGVEYSKLHANWLIKIASEARTENVVKLIELGKSRVFEKFGVILEPEIRIWTSEKDKQ